MGIERKHRCKSHALYFLLTGFCVLFTLCKTFPAGAAASHIVFPPVDVTVAQGVMQIILTGSEKTAELTIRNGEGEQKKRISFSKQSGSIEINLVEGDNEISLSDGTSVNEKRHIRLKPTGKIDWHIHSSGILTRQCDNCHMVALRGVINYRHRQQKVSCSSGQCHPAMGTEKFLHGPVKKGQCIGCHNPHGSSIKNFLYRERAELCLI